MLIEPVVCCLIFLSINPRASSVAPYPLLSSLGRLARSELVVKSERLSGRGDFRDYELSAYFYRQLHEFVTVGAARLFLSSAVCDFFRSGGRQSACTLRASLSGIFLQTLPELVTPLNRHSMFISGQLSTDAVSALRKVNNKTVEAT